MDVTISAYRTCGGGLIGGGHVHSAVLDAAREAVSAAKTSGAIADGFVARCGADVDIVLLGKGPASGVAADVLSAAAAAREQLWHHANGGVSLDGTELTIELRADEPVLVLFASGAGAGAWNVPVCRMLGDPFVVPGLARDPQMSAGSSVQVAGASGTRTFALPDDYYRLVGAIADGGVVVGAQSRATGAAAASVSGGADPIVIVRCGAPYPDVEDVLEACLEPGCLGDPLVPVAATGDASVRVMPRAMGLGFQVTAERLLGPRDLFGDGSLDELRRSALAAVRSRAAGRWRTPAPELAAR